MADDVAMLSSPQAAAGHPRSGLTLRTTAYLALGLISLILVLAIAGSLYDNWREQRAARNLNAINAANALLMASAADWAVERGLTNIALNTPAPAAADVGRELERRRKRADEAFNMAMHHLAAEALDPPQSLVRRAHVANTAVQELRRLIDAALARPVDERERGLLAVWMPAATDLIMSARELALAVDGRMLRSRLVFTVLAIRDAAWVMSEYAGRERAILGAHIAEGRYPDAATRRRLLTYEGRVQGAWDQLSELSVQIGEAVGIDQVYFDARRTFFEQFEEVRSGVYRAIDARTPYPLDAETWLRESTEAIDSLLGIVRAAGHVAENEVRRTSERTQMQTMLHVGLFALAIVGAGAAVLLIAFRVIQPLQHITNTMLRLADGASNIPIPFTRRRDEIGAMAMAIQSFRRSTLEERRLRTEVERRRQIEAELRRANEDAQAANRAKTAFLANVSHELRTPLNAIIGFSDMLRYNYGGPLTPRQEQYAADIHSSGQHLLELINEVLDLSKIEAGRMELHPERVDVSDTFEWVMRMVAERAERNGVGVDASVAPGMPDLFADDRMLRQMLINLLSNALKFTPSGGRITLRAGVDGAGAYLEVADTGIGMAEEDIPKAMSLFGQINDPMHKRHDGTGIGLPLVGRMIASHGGELTIDSSPGEGTAVRLRFPPERVLRPGAAIEPGRSVARIPIAGGPAEA